MLSTNDSRMQKGVRSTLNGIIANIFLIIIKATAGILGNSYALIADAIESASDVITSIFVIIGLKLSRRPPDKSHPYGHGKFEPLSAAFVAFCLFAAAIVIIIESIKQIKTPHEAPAPFTLVVLVVTILIKEYLFRSVIKVGQEVGSSAVITDAWHHRSDSLTSLAAFIGIAVALLLGKGYESADDYAALFAALIIIINSFLLFKPALYELLDAAPDPGIAEQIREIAMHVKGVKGTHKCHVRKLGFDFFVELDVLCDPELTIRAGHDIAHDVGEAIHNQMPIIAKVIIHVEPEDDFGRRSRDNLGEPKKNI